MATNTETSLTKKVWTLATTLAGKASFFRNVGLHAFAAYILSEMISPIMGHTGLSETIFGVFDKIMPANCASLLYSLLFSFVIC